MNYSKYIISKGGKELGISFYDIERYLLTPEQNKRFLEWMRGQTCGCVDDSCDTSVCYTGDFKRFINNQSVID